MKTHKRAWLLIGILACSAAAILAAGAAGSRKPQKHIPFTITFKAEDRYDDGRVVQAFTETRYVSSTGDWRSIRQLPSGATIERVGIVGRGVYTVDAQAQKLWFNSSYADRFPKAGERLRSDNYVRTEAVAGFTTDVVRVEAAGKSAEFYQAPDLNNFTIKQVERDAQFVRSIEPTSIILGEPSADSLKFPEYAEDRSRYQAGGQFKAQTQQGDDLPIADYSSALPEDAKERTKRRARNKRYDLPSDVKKEDVSRFTLKEDDPAILLPLSSSHPKTEPAIPVADSDAVIIGEVVNAQAYLSNDKTRVYSEFTVRISDVLKGGSDGTLYAGAQIDAERPGGRVRFLSGKILQRGAPYGKNMPRVGQRYLLFLKQNDEGQDYSIITGYELRGGRIFPLDRSPQGNAKSSQFAEYEKYTDSDEIVFLNDVRTAIEKGVQK